MRVNFRNKLKKYIIHVKSNKQKHNLGKFPLFKQANFNPAGNFLVKYASV